MKRLIPYAGSERIEFRNIREEQKKQRRKVSIDAVLDLWAEGHEREEIARRIGLVNGSLLRGETITALIVKARKAGDPRAKAKRVTKS